MAAGEDSIQQTVQFFSEKEQISFEEIIVPGNFLKIVHENLLDPSVLTGKGKAHKADIKLICWKSNILPLSVEPEEFFDIFMFSYLGPNSNIS